MTEIVAKTLQLEKVKKQHQHLLDDLVIEEVNFEAEIESREAQQQYKRKMP